MRPDAPRGWPVGFARGRAGRDALLVLAHVATVTPRELHALAWREGSAAGCLRAVRRGALGEAAREAAEPVDAARVRRRLGEAGARALFVGDRGFPERLLDLADPPAWLFVRGGLPEARAVAVVGARRCTAYGREMAGAIARGLAEAGVCVVSGAAAGVDGAAHQGALAGGGPTVAVLGSGIDVAYPGSNRQLIERVAAEGAVVSEYPPGTPAGRRRFPARNRIIAALSEAVVVVEGAAGSGSLITAELADDVGRTICAVPGPATSPLSEAPHDLIRDGAVLVGGAADVLREIGVERTGADVPAAERLPSEERRALAAVAGTPVTAEAVALVSGLLPGEVLPALASLELRGLVRVVGGRYARTPLGAGLGT